MPTVTFGSRASRIAWALIGTAVQTTGAAGRQPGLEVDCVWSALFKGSSMSTGDWFQLDSPVGALLT